MNRIICLLLYTTLFFSVASAQKDGALLYRKTTAMIPMRDGIKLFTVILSPINASVPVPVLMQRTPYGADIFIPKDSAVSLNGWPQMGLMAKDGYIIVMQDIRGKYKSEGSMQIHQPLIHATQKGAVDESTDTYDAIEWLIKNIPNNNGKAGILGISYPGWLALVGSVDPHPALKA
ncbi:MAG TPA: CocE/NonD family hydrolase, partial [Chitinophagaceae bacterium]|nr:CocE/NonD family hydrolase [Chitinophagaceae bacterium]